MKQDKNITNEALINLIAVGDEQAFAVLFERYRDRLYSYLVRVTKSKETAEEATLDVFLKIWNARAALKEINNFDAFLFRVAHNKALDYIRQAAGNRSLQKEIWADLQKLATTETADQKLLKADTEAKINDAISHLSEQRKEAFRLSREELLSYDEIAQRMHISRHTVRNHITAALSFIRRHLDQGPEIASIMVLWLNG
ncbi:MAG: RNA polymerase sigma-70 factor [Chitinophagaceae bacterium]|nr:RNA polymerase sigma-70 factor [Chitinophagaceae bacterium]